VQAAVDLGRVLSAAGGDLEIGREDVVLEQFEFDRAALARRQTQGQAAWARAAQGGDGVAVEIEQGAAADGEAGHRVGRGRARRAVAEQVDGGEGLGLAAVVVHLQRHDAGFDRGRRFGGDGGAGQREQQAGGQQGLPEATALARCDGIDGYVHSVHSLRICEWPRSGMATSVSLARGHAVAARRRRRARAQPQPSVAADWRSCADCTGLRHPMGAYPSLQRRGSPLVHVDAGRWRIRNRRLRHRT